MARPRDPQDSEIIIGSPGFDAARAREQLSGSFVSFLRGRFLVFTRLGAGDLYETSGVIPKAELLELYGVRALGSGASTESPADASAEPENP